MQEDNLKNTETDKVNTHCDFDYSKAKPNRFAACLAQEQSMAVHDFEILNQRADYLNEEVTDALAYQVFE
jgi:hypothetical protein